MALSSTSGLTGSTQFANGASGIGRTTGQYGALGRFTASGGSTSYNSAWSGFTSTPALEVSASLRNLTTGATVYSYTSVPLSTVFQSGTLSPGNYEWRVDALSVNGTEGASVTAGNNLSLPDLAHSARVTSSPGSGVVPTHSTFSVQAVNVTLTVTAAGDAPITYLWRHNGSPLANGGALTGTDTPSLTITGFDASWNGLYDCRVINPRDTVFSDPAMIEADHVTSPPMVFEQPETAVLNPTDVDFFVGVASSGPLTYQWTLDGAPLTDGSLPSGAEVIGAQSDFLVIMHPTAAEVGSYTCVLTNDAGTTMTLGARLAPSVLGADRAATGDVRFASWPNPASGDATLRFEMPRQGRAGLAILDLAGRRVRDLGEGAFEAGDQFVRWDLRDAAGRRVEPGLYFARLLTESGMLTARIVVSR